MTTIYVFELNENKYYITEFKNEIIEPIKEMVKKLVPENDSDKIKSLLIQNLGTTISSFEWIKKYPIKTIAEIKENSNIEKVSIYYIKEYGLENVRSDMCKDIELSDNLVKYIQTILNHSDLPVPIRIKLIDQEINKLKSTFNFITENNIIIDKYLKYSLYGVIRLLSNHLFDKFANQLNDKQINVLIPNFIDTFIKSMKENFSSNLDDYIKIKVILEEYFFNQKILEEISNALLLKKKIEKLISKYGTLDELNKKIVNMLNRKIELIHMLELDDIQEDEDEDDSDEDDSDDEDDEDDEEDEEDEEDEDNKNVENRCDDCGEGTVQLVLVNNKPTLKCMNCD